MNQDRMPTGLDTLYIEIFLCLVNIANMNVDAENGRKCIFMVARLCRFVILSLLFFVFSPGVIERRKDENAMRKDENNSTKQKTAREIAERPDIASYTK